MVILALCYLGSGHQTQENLLTSGGDLRLLHMLRLRPKDAPNPIIAISREGAQSFQANLVRSVSVLCVDESFRGPSRGSIFSIVTQISRTATFLLKGLVLSRFRSGTLLYSSSNLLPDVLAATTAKLFKARVRWVAVVHHIPFGSEYSSERWMRRALSISAANWSAWLAAHLADVVVAYHQPTIQRLLELGLPRERLFENGNGVDIAEIKSAMDLAGPRKTKSAICVGRFSRQKGTERLLQIWKHVSLAEPEATLTLVGANESFTPQDLKLMTESLGISESVNIRGRLPREDVLRLLASSTVALFPSFVEGWGIALMESIACKTPVVAWDLPAYGPMLSAITPIPLGDYSEFARRTVELLRKGNPRNRESEEFDWGAGRYRIESVCEREWALIKSVGVMTEATQVE